MILLVVILSAGCFVSAGSYGLCCWFRVYAGGHTSAGGFISTDGVVVYATNTSIYAAGVVLVDKLPDDEIVDPRVKVETVSDYASSPPRNRRKHLGVRSDDCLWDKPVEDFFSSESESDDDMENYIPPLPYGEFKDWEMSLHSEDVEDFWHTQDEWIVCSWKLYPKSSVHVLDLTNGKTVYMFVDKFYPIRATVLERMLRHRLTVPPSYCRDVVVAVNIIRKSLADHCKRL
ncbi:hypothetical protein Tco_0055699, partial [Tanacetum coccineum]